MPPRRILSGIQPTGLMHVGNYFGAVKNWVALQDPDPVSGDKADCLYCVVDYHSITVAYERKELAPRSLELTLDLLACGIDPERSTIFLQSQIPQHTELAWVLAAVTAYGDLTRMTQFKDKGSTQEFVSTGLFTYPVLMAADILVYKATHVPVGADQKQHLELSQEIGRKFNFTFGETFPKPEPLWTQAPKVMSLVDPTKKMSKSSGDKHYVGVFEDPATAKKKIKSAVTDTGGAPAAEMSPGVKNLFLLLEQTAPKSALEPLLADHAAGKLKYGDLKEAVATHLMAALDPMRERRKRLTEKDALAALAKGREKAHAIAAKTMGEVRDRIGLLKVP
jgi:tryptophanyl-tRNA synthetase